jgi:hypothetical protein
MREKTYSSNYSILGSISLFTYPILSFHKPQYTKEWDRSTYESILYKPRKEGDGDMTKEAHELELIINVNIKHTYQEVLRRDKFTWGKWLQRRRQRDLLIHQERRMLIPDTRR